MKPAQPTLDAIRARLVVISSMAMSQPLAFGYFIRRTMQEVVEPLVAENDALRKKVAVVEQIRLELRGPAEGDQDFNENPVACILDALDIALGDETMCGEHCTCYECGERS